MTTQHSPRTVQGNAVRRTARWSGRGLALLWAGFWTWFAAAEIVSGETGAVMHLLAPVLPCWALFAAMWRWPRVGSGLMLLGAAALALLFQHPGAWMLLSIPMVVIAVLAWIGRIPAHEPAAEREASPAAR